MQSVTEAGVRIVEATGPVGAIVVAVLAGLVLGAIIIFYLAGLFQQSDFQKRLIEAFDRLSASEAALRKEVDALQEENAHLKDTIRELTASVDLLRAQNKRFLEMMRPGLGGQVAPSDVGGATVGETSA